MSSFAAISTDKLARLIGLPATPVLIDVRLDADVADDPRLIPGAQRRAHTEVTRWAARCRGRAVIVICQRGLKLSHGVAAWLRHEGVAAQVLEGGFEAWRQAGLALVPQAALPDRDGEGRTLWVTRARPKIDRIACPWLIRRFVDPHAVFLFVAPSEVRGVAERFGATPFDIEDVAWSHDGDLCTFDVMLRGSGLASPPLDHLARIIRAADTGRLEQEPEAAGLLAASLGLSRLHGDDLSQLEAGLSLYDAFYRWCRDARHETHGWPAPKAVAS